MLSPVNLIPSSLVLTCWICCCSRRFWLGITIKVQGGGMRNMAGPGTLWWGRLRGSRRCWRASSCSRTVRLHAVNMWASGSSNLGTHREQLLTFVVAFLGDSGGFESCHTFSSCSWLSCFCYTCTEFTKNGASWLSYFKIINRTVGSETTHTPSVFA